MKQKTIQGSINLNKHAKIPAWNESFTILSAKINDNSVAKEKILTFGNAVEVNERTSYKTPTQINNVRLSEEVHSWTLF